MILLGDEARADEAMVWIAILLFLGPGMAVQPLAHALLLNGQTQVVSTEIRSNQNQILTFHTRQNPTPQRPCIPLPPHRPPRYRGNQN